MGKGGKGGGGFVDDEYYGGKGGKGSKGYAYYEDGFTGIKGSKYGSGGFTGGAKGGKGGFGLTAEEFGVNVNTYVEGGSGYEYSYQTENGQVVATQASGEAWSSF